jgi:hypothetical protein
VNVLWECSFPVLGKYISIYINRKSTCKPHVCRTNWPQIGNAAHQTDSKCTSKPSNQPTITCILFTWLVQETFVQELSKDPRNMDYASQWNSGAVHTLFDYCSFCRWGQKMPRLSQYELRCIFIDVIHEFHSFPYYLKYLSTHSIFCCVLLKKVFIC